MTSHHFADWVSTIQVPHGTAIRIFENGNVSRRPNRILYLTNRQFAGLKNQKPIKLKKELLPVKKSKRS